jgi:kelch-like protein 1/4/5
MDSSKGAINIEEYDVRNNNWTLVGPMASRRLQFGLAVLNGHLFIVGGRDGLKTLNTVECYNPITAQCSPVTSMNTHRHGLGVAVLNGPLYAVGGHDGWSYLSTAERYTRCLFNRLIIINVIIDVNHIYMNLFIGMTQLPNSGVLLLL